MNEGCVWVTHSKIRLPLTSMLRMVRQPQTADTREDRTGRFLTSKVNT